MFIDEFLSLFKNQISLDDLKNNLSYKDALIMRETRIKRLEREHKEMGFDKDSFEDAMS